jgi:hypothetical protein
MDFILHPSAFILPMWPDSGLTRNTRDLRYRCSVPGLAGFTEISVVRSPKPDNLSKVGQTFVSVSSILISDRNSLQLDGRLAMRQHSQQSIDGEMQQDIRNYRNNDRQ